LLDAVLDAAGHAGLELRRVALGLCADLERWSTARDGDDASAALRRHLAECRAQVARTTGPIAGLDGSASGRRRRKTEPAGELARLEAVLAALDRSALDTPLARLRRAAGLSELDVDLLLLGALPHQSALWGALFAFLAGAPGVRRPTVHVALNFLRAADAGAGPIFAALASGPLVRYGLVRLEPPDAPLADRAITVPAEVWLALCGHDAVDPVLAPWLDPPAPPPNAPILPAPVQAEVDALARRGELRVVVAGGPGTGRHTVARWLAAAARPGAPVVALRLPPGEPPVGWSTAAVRHAIVRGASLVIAASAAHGETVILGLDLPPSVPAFLVLPDRTDVRAAAFAGAVRIRVPQPTGRERGALWQRALGAEPTAPAGIDPAELASRYGMNGGGITDVVRAARQLAALRADPDAPTPAVPARDDLVRAARLRPAVALEALAARREARASADDLILPKASLAQLDELTARVRHRDRVFEDWGFAGRVGHRQTSVLSLFTGPSGTGKTLAAEVVAARLGLDLYCIDLSQVVSKYIGETEKNLSRVFDAAEGTAAVLFFDEADGIFGKRTETRDAHDRYANLEVSYLLARLETFAGLAIMASNLRQNIDAAFLRRMDYVIEFPAPDTHARHALWQRHLRCDAPIDDDVNAGELAELFPVTGAHIRNAAVGGAFFAAADHGRLTRRHLVAAMRREYEKLGKSFPAGAAG
jgi:hypothetical protein